MPFFKSTKDIFVTPWEDEVHNDNWFDTPFLQLPPSEPWDYQREMTIDDVDIWEQIYFESGGTGLYAAWSPYAEFYMITKNIYIPGNMENVIELFYGPMASKNAFQRAVELGMPVQMKKLWVSDEDLWLYSEEYEEENKIIIL